MESLSIEQALARADDMVRKNDFETARLLYNAILDAFPMNSPARQGLSDIEKQLSDNKISKTYNNELMKSLVIMYNNGLYQDLVKQAEVLVSHDPNSVFVWNILGAGKLALGQPVEAEKAFRKASYLNPQYSDAHNNLGASLRDQGKIDEAILAYRRALELRPAYAEAHNNLGVALRVRGETGEAVVACRRAIEIKPHYAEAYYNLGIALHEQGKLDEAITAYQGALKLRPIYPVAENNLGVAFQGQGRLDEAIAAYRRALEATVDYAEPYNNLGAALHEQGQFGQAIAAYERAIEIKPAYAEAFNNLGNAFKSCGRLDDAIAAYRRALEVEPMYAEAFNNLGNSLHEGGRLDEAIVAYTRALDIKPNYAAAEAQLLHQMQRCCDFSVSGRLEQASSRLGIEGQAVPPFASLPWADCPEQQLRRSQKWAEENYKQSPTMVAARPLSRPERLKVGYFSADFHDHATIHLMAGLLREHDRNAFEIFAYSYGRNQSGDWRRRAEGDARFFFDIKDLSDFQIVELARAHNLDIAIDLKGYTHETRSGIFKYRLAPIQINYLGYPGSMGAEFIDYIVADPVVVPPDQRAFYSEKVIYLPHCYQPNDDARAIARNLARRTDVGLPEDSFVFCCFNNNYKIGPREYDVWMRLLRKVDGSVLWLLRSNQWAEENLRKEAERHSVHPSRVIFARNVPQQEHLARHRHADLFVDTFNYNAHTTASDALWAGLPIVTMRGKQFAARVGASLLAAVGLPELITDTVEQYEDLILSLATRPEKLSAVKRKLEVNRLREPLFDTIRYTRNFEKGLWRAFDRYFCGNEAEDIWVNE